MTVSFLMTATDEMPFRAFHGGRPTEIADTCPFTFGQADSIYTRLRMTVKAGKVVVAFSVLFVGSLLLLKDVPGRNAPARRELRTIKDPPRQKRKGGGARDLKVANSPAGRDGRKLSFDETKEVLLKVLNGPEGFRVLKTIAAKMDSDAGAAADGEDAEQSRRLGHHLTVHFPDCVLAGEAECKEAILADLESNPDLYQHIGGFVEFETRKKRSDDPDDPDHDKVVLKTDSTGTKVIGLNGDCIGRSNWVVMHMCLFICGFLLLTRSQHMLSTRPLIPLLTFAACIHIFSAIFVLLQCTILSSGSRMAWRLPSGRGIAPLGNIQKNSSIANLSVRQIVVT